MSAFFCGQTVKGGPFQTGVFSRQCSTGRAPLGIEAELNAWLTQYPTAWLAVDLRDGVIPPSTQTPLAKLLENTKRNVLIIVSSSSDNEEWPQWKLPF